MSERSSVRRHLFLYLDVINRKNNELLGYLGDISEQGLMFISQLNINPDQLLDIRIEMPENVQYIDKPYLDIQVKTRWSEPNINPQLNCIGCQFVEFDKKDLPLIHQITDLLTFDEGFEIKRVHRPS
ncbi:PilZ domain-containing protein [Beggiatoa alba B18LD]|uniref:PilZ domain-containing protein n=1 Tax=Beggiatoa alba B18LD TaxID=395493 RepID=I3CFK5_9GAMM|nr:PilZ domain-containing protein [Beggiatoa alba]EIJ42398.1 PilZ domain-containing protein [Beggiatoa alba B18LD]